MKGILGAAWAVGCQPTGPRRAIDTCSLTLIQPRLGTNGQRPTQLGGEDMVAHNLKNIKKCQSWIHEPLDVLTDYFSFTKCYLEGAPSLTNKGAFIPGFNYPKK
jgi:hypothetical protein